MADPYAGLNPVLARQVQQMIQASNGRIYLKSGYRSVEEQTKLYNAAVQRYGPDNAGKWVAPPGRSNHNHGAAVDLGGDLDVMAQLAPQFGLAQPMSWEPWHYEMASTRDTADPQAYTVTPPGNTDPITGDFSQSPPHVAATMAEGLMGLDSSMLGTAGAPLDQIIQTLPSEGQQAAAPASTGGGTQTSAGGASYTGGGNVAPTQLYTALIGQGLPPAAAAAFVSIAGRESGFNTAAYNGNRSTGDDSVGLFQINLLNGGWAPFLEAHGMSDPRSALKTLQGSVQAAAWMYQSSGLHPWGGYKGMPWWYSTDLNTGSQASGGAVSTADMEALGGG